VLIVDDDRRIRELLTNYLAGEGYRATSAGSAAEARERMRGLAFDILVLDVMMPGENGIALAESLRREARDEPVLFLSALADAEDRIAGLEAGGDDYLVKPFEPRELLLRIQNLLRRRAARSGGQAEVGFGPFTFHPGRGELRRAGELVRLTTRERDLLRIFVAGTGRTLTRADLAASGDAESARAIDVQINRLRRKIEDDPAEPVHLQTVRGMGYIFHID
jgi:two-component system phosphate regulon response regulator OmpR